MLKGINRILNLCTDFINEIDDFEDVQLNPEFFCYPTTNEVFVSVVAVQNAVEEFMTTLLKRTEVEDISEFTWSLLHEVGHCETWHIMNKRTTNHCKNIKRKITRGTIPTIEYYSLTDEKIATDWAIRYTEENYEIVKAFDKKITKALKKFFTENEVEG